MRCDVRHAIIDFVVDGHFPIVSAIKDIILGISVTICSRLSVRFKRAKWL